jgi:tetratricopeptide (TPR) repeat protein
MPISPEQEAELVKALSKQRILIADSSSSRKSLRKLLGQFQVASSMIDVVDSYSDACEMINGRRPNIIFAESSLPGESVLGLIEIQKNALQAGEPRVFFFSTTKDSNAILSGAAEETVDGMILKPFTFDLLLEVFATAMLRKLNPTPYEKLINEGQAHMRVKESEEALKLFRSAIPYSPKPALARYWEGQALEQLEQIDEALQCYELGLSHDPLHYRCLLGLFEGSFKNADNEKAYKTGQKLCAHHAVPFKHIPLLIRVSIRNKKFDEVLAFYKDADALHRVEPTATLSLAAGLVVCGMWMLKQGNKGQALDAFRKAEMSSQGNPKILLRIIVELASKGFETEMKAMMSRLPEGIKDSPEIRLAELDFHLSHAGSEPKALQAALELIQLGQDSAKVYRVAIELSTKLGRKDKHVRELFDQAVAKHPELTELGKRFE